ncbi:N,N-dimethylformamidase beta subunit family domain-containing protein [Mesorhizobium sp. M0965]|uniref:N,N-dimethylformamidase beta subunit family domain-containing protein n=1 Tax=Mesorhizobium sp. M0965 TaxID=2957036 RepID=UPI00333618B0
MPDRPVILAYADRTSVKTGESLGFAVSCLNLDSFDCDFVRLLGFDAGPEMPPFQPPVIPVPEAKRYPGSEKPIFAGSYVKVAGSHRFEDLASVTVCAYVMPTLIGGQPRCIISTLASGGLGGIALRLEADGCLAAILGGPNEPRIYRVVGPLPLWLWSFIALSYNHQRRQLHIFVQSLASGTHDDVGANWLTVDDVDPPERGDGGVLIAAGLDENGIPCHHFNGKIERPRILAAALSIDELTVLASRRPTDPLRWPCLADWNLLSEPASEMVRDESDFGHHGVCVNHPTRAVQGLLWESPTTDWRQAPEQYSAAHFHHDDIESPGWQEDLRLTVPTDWPSGCYAARLRGGDAEFFVPFFVRKSADAVGDVAFLAPTATYTAYVNMVTQQQRIEYGLGCLGCFYTPLDLLATELPGLGKSLYDAHDDGSGRWIGSLRRPVLNMQPGGWLWNFQIDLCLLGWLARAAPDHQVLTDEDLDREGLAALDGCRVLVTGSHPEYWSLTMLQALDGFLARGGRLMYLGGNGFGHTIDFHPQRNGLVELRRRRSKQGRVSAGDVHSSFTGRPCGAWAEHLGRPEQALVGVGYLAEAFDRGSYYRRLAASDDARARFIFAGVTEDVIGDFGIFGGAAGLEIDIANVELGTPRHALVVAASEQHGSSYARGPSGLSYFTGLWNDAPKDPIRADMTFFETPAGGAVFSVGSIAWGSSLPHADYVNNVAHISENVLGRFRDPAPFQMPRK